MRRDAAIEALQSLVGPDGWRDVSAPVFDWDRRFWELSGAAWGFVAVRVLLGSKVGWYRVSARGPWGRIVVDVEAVRAQAALAEVCGVVEAMIRP